MVNRATEPMCLYFCSLLFISGVYNIQIIDIFAPPPAPPFPKFYFFPGYTENFLFFPFFPTSYPLIFAFFSFFPKTTNNSYFLYEMKNIHLWFISIK